LNSSTLTQSISLKHWAIGEGKAENPEQSRLYQNNTIMSVSIKTGKVENFTTDRAEDTWYTVKFDNPYLSSVTPKVFVQIQTYGGGDTPGLRIQNVTHEGFEVRMDEIQGSYCSSGTVGDLGTVKSDGSHNPETLAWMAIN